MQTRRLRHVVQKNRNSGCGPAAVAILAGVTYEEGRLAMFPDGRTRDLSSNYTLARQALKRLGVGFDPAVKRVNVWGHIETIALVTCTRNGRWHHWVVYDPTLQVVYDPYEERPIHPLFSRQRPLSYLKIIPEN